jgi:hypothetical protein
MVLHIILTHFLTISSFISLLRLVAFPSFFNGIISLVIIHYYKHLCTNRYLIRAIVRAQLIYYLFDFMFTIWNIVAMFLLFKNVDWNHKENLTYAESLMYSGTYSLTYSLTHSITYLFIHRLCEHISPGNPLCGCNSMVW